MYPKYTTSAFILSSAYSGEADKVVSFYTRDFGLIRAVAKSVRLEKSKLKAYLETGNFVTVSLVKGKEIWRLTDVEIKKDNLSFQDKEHKIFLRIIKLLKTLIQGEEKNEILFETLSEILNFLKKGGFSEENLDGVECLAVMRILDALGYGHEKIDWGISNSMKIGEGLLLEVAKNKKKLIGLINKSLEHSHL